MNLYKVGAADAVLNHSVPNAWLDVVRRRRITWMPPRRRLPTF